MGVWAVFGGGRLTLLSRLACSLPLLSTLGCTQSFQLEGRHARQVVADYTAKQQVELTSAGKRYFITPRQQPRLRIHSDTCVASRGSSESDAACGDFEAPLIEARVTGDRLQLPPHAPLRLDSIDQLELIVDGKPSRALGGGSRPPGWRPTQLWGVQLGGSGYAQVSFRWAFVKYLHLELGAFAIGPELAVNGSAGLIGELPFQDGWALYVGAGGGGGVVGGAEQEECGKPIEECPLTHSTQSTEFWYGRVGVAKYFKWVIEQQRVGIDVGFWRGILREGPPDQSESFIWPMAGVSYHVAL